VSETSQDTVKLAEELGMKGINLFFQNLELTTPIESMFDAALKLLDESIGLWPFSNTLNIKAQILKRRGDLSGAITNVDAAIKIAPHDPTIWLSKGNILCSDDRISEGKKCYIEALKKYESADYLSALNLDDIAKIPSEMEIVMGLRDRAARYGFEPNWMGTYIEGSWPAKHSRNFDAELFFDGNNVSGWIREPNTSKRIDKSIPYLFSKLYGVISGDNVTLIKEYEGRDAKGDELYKVNYNGKADIMGRSISGISGTWSIRGNSSGKFEMKKSA